MLPKRRPGLASARTEARMVLLLLACPAPPSRWAERVHLAYAEATRVELGNLSRTCPSGRGGLE
jgi:hypothetical protein